MGRLTPTPFHVYEGPDGTLVVRGELDMGTVDELQAKISAGFEGDRCPRRMGAGDRPSHGLCHLVLAGVLS